MGNALAVLEGTGSEMIQMIPHAGDSAWVEGAARAAEIRASRMRDLMEFRKQK